MKVKIQILWVGDAISTFQVDGIECFTIMRRKLAHSDVDNSTWLGYAKQIWVVQRMCKATLGIATYMQRNIGKIAK